MDAQDRISEGWQVWLTPRQTRIIYDALARHDPATEKDSVAWRKLKEWFWQFIDMDLYKDEHKIRWKSAFKPLWLDIYNMQLMKKYQ